MGQDGAGLGQSAEAIDAVAEAQIERVFRIMDMDRLLKVA